MKFFHFLSLSVFLVFTPALIAGENSKDIKSPETVQPFKQEKQPKAKWALYAFHPRKTVKKTLKRPRSPIISFKGSLESSSTAPLTTEMNLERIYEIETEKGVEIVKCEVLKFPDELKTFEFIFNVSTNNKSKEVKFNVRSETFPLTLYENAGHRILFDKYHQEIEPVEFDEYDGRLLKYTLHRKGRIPFSTNLHTEHVDAAGESIFVLDNQPTGIGVNNDQRIQLRLMKLDNNQGLFTGTFQIEFDNQTTSKKVNIINLPETLFQGQDFKVMLDYDHLR